MNKKIKIIELLNKIANGEKIKEFRYKDYIYQKHKFGYYRSVVGSNWIGFHADFDLCNKYILQDEEVEILEDNTEEIEELDIPASKMIYDVEPLKDKINELVKAINSIRKDKNNE